MLNNANNVTIASYLKYYDALDSGHVLEICILLEYYIIQRYIFYCLPM